MRLEKLTKEIVQNLYGSFTWDFGSNFVITTTEGTFIWSDPDYNGDNSIKRFNGSINDYFKDGFGRDKGYHLISRYCGTNFTYDDTVVINNRGDL